MSSQGMQNYANTIIFCLVMKIIAIIVLGIVIFNFAHPMIIYFLITVEIGLVIVVIFALLNIAAYEKRMAAEAKALMTTRMDMIVCPDYHTRSNNDMCASTYTTGDGRFTYEMGSFNVSLSNYTNRPLDNVCKTFTNDAFGGTYVPESNLYPWTYLQSKCDVI